VGSINTSTTEKKRYAQISREYNLKDPVFCSIFEELAAKLREEIAEERRVQGIAENSMSSQSEEPKS
jgi:ubiquitin-conjugating enzyme E2 J2